MVRQVASPSLPRSLASSQSFSAFPSGPSNKLPRTPLKSMDEPQVPVSSNQPSRKGKEKADIGPDYAVKIVVKSKARPRSSVHASTAGQTPAFRRQSGAKVGAVDLDPDADTDVEDTGLRTPPDSQADPLPLSALQRSAQARLVMRAGSTSRLPTPPTTQSLSSIPSQLTPLRPSQRRRSAPLGSPANPSPNPRARKNPRFSSSAPARRAPPATAPRPARPAPRASAPRRISSSQPIRKRRQSTPVRDKLTKSTSARAIENFGSRKGDDGFLIHIRDRPISPPDSPGDDPMLLGPGPLRPKTAAASNEDDFNLLDVAMPPSSARSSRSRSLAKSRSPSMLRDQAPPSNMSSIGSPSWSLPVPSPRPGPVARTRTSRSVSFRPEESSKTPTRPVPAAYDLSNFAADGFNSDDGDDGAEADDTFVHMRAVPDESNGVELADEPMLDGMETFDEGFETFEDVWEDVEDAQPLEPSTERPSTSTHLQEDEVRVLPELAKEVQVQADRDIHAEQTEVAQFVEKQDRELEQLSPDEIFDRLAVFRQRQRTTSPFNLLSSPPHFLSSPEPRITALSPSRSDRSPVQLGKLAHLAISSSSTRELAPSFAPSSVEAPQIERLQEESSLSTNAVESTTPHQQLRDLSPERTEYPNVNGQPIAATSIEELCQTASNDGHEDPSSEAQQEDDRKSESNGVRGGEHEDDLSAESAPGQQGVGLLITPREAIFECPDTQQQAVLSPTPSVTSGAPPADSSPAYRQDRLEYDYYPEQVWETSACLKTPPCGSDDAPASTTPLFSPSSRHASLESPVVVSSLAQSCVQSTREGLVFPAQQGNEVAREDDVSEDEGEDSEDGDEGEDDGDGEDKESEDESKSGEGDEEGDVTVEADPADWEETSDDGRHDKQSVAPLEVTEQGPAAEIEADEDQGAMLHGSEEVTGHLEQLDEQSDRIVLRLVQRTIKLETPERDLSGAAVCEDDQPASRLALPTTPPSGQYPLIQSTTPLNSPPVPSLAQMMPQPLAMSQQRPVFRFTHGNGGTAALEAALRRRSSGESRSAASERTPLRSRPVAPPLPSMSRPRPLFEELQGTGYEGKIDAHDCSEVESEDSEDDIALHGSVVEVSSMNPKAAARAAAILKMNHDYIEHGVIPPDGLYQSGERSSKSIGRAHLDKSYRTEAGDMTCEELLQEAELDIFANGRRSRSASQGPSAFAPTEGSDDEDVRLPGSFVFTPGRKRKAKTPRSVRRRSIAAPMDDRSWGVPEWKRLERCFRGERKLWTEERATKNAGRPSHGGLLAWARRSQAAPQAQPWDNDRVIDRFIKESKLERADLTGEWARDVLLLRVEALGRRLSASSKAPSVSSSSPRKRARTVSPPPAPATPARAVAVTKTPAAPPSTVKRVLGYVFGGLTKSTRRQTQPSRSPPRPRATPTLTKPISPAKTQSSSSSISRLPVMRQTSGLGASMATSTSSLATSSMNPSLSTSVSQRSSAIQALFAPEANPALRSAPRPIPLPTRQSSGLSNSSLSRSQSVKELVRSFESQENLNELYRANSRASTSSKR